MYQKIIHVINDFPSKSETFIVNHIVETIKAGYEVQILVNNLNPISTTSQLQMFKTYGLYDIAKSFKNSIPKNKILRLLKAVLILLKHLRFASVFIRTLNGTKYGAKSKSLKMWFQAATFIKFRNVDIFHGHFAISGQLLVEMKEIGAITGKIVTSFYGYDTFSTPENRNKLKNEYKDLFTYSDVIITSSKYLAENLSLLEAPKQKIKINHVGVDVEKFKFLERKLDKSIKLITVGRLIKLKGQHLGIRAVKSLVDQRYNIDYTIVGSGEEVGNLNELIKELSLENYITLKNLKSQNKVLQELNNCHLFLMTSITDDSGRAEGQGLVTAEAQATGIPVVGFNSGGIPETIQNELTGFIVEENNVDELANAIEYFIKNPDSIIEMGKKGRAYIEKEFNSAIQSKKIIDVYKGL